MVGEFISSSSILAHIILFFVFVLLLLFCFCFWGSFLIGCQHEAGKHVSPQVSKSVSKLVTYVVSSPAVFCLIVCVLAFFALISLVRLDSKRAGKSMS